MSKTKFQLTVGSDPELFLRERSSGKIVSAIPVVKFDKENRIDLKNGFNFYYDNVSVEGNVPPATSKDEFVGNIATLIERIEKHLGGKYEAVPVASHVFPEAELQDEAAQVIGCNPFFLSHSQEVAMPPEFKDGVRASGFHIHLGRADYAKCSGEEFLIDPLSKISVINYMDLFVGVPSIVFDNGEDSRFRKGLYTQSAGAHRPTAYGVEYRPLSASCMRSKELVALIYDLTIAAVEAAQSERSFKGVDDDQVVECINTCDVAAARKIMSKVLTKEQIRQVESFANV